MIDGPQSLLTQSSRYGLQMAMILPIFTFISGQVEYKSLPCYGALET